MFFAPALLLASPGRAWAQESEDGWDDHPPAHGDEPAPTFGGTDEGDDLAASPEEDEAPRRRGISPRWFWASLALGLGLGVGAGVTGGYALSLNQLYLEDRSDPLLRERGMALQLATNVMVGVAGGMALVALLTGIFTDWSPRPRPEEDEDDVAWSPALGSAPVAALGALALGP